MQIERAGFWGTYMRVRISHDVDEPIRSKLESHDFAEDKLYRLNVKYERLPRFCSYCGHLGHGQRDCKLPEDLQEMRFSAAMRSSPFKRSGSRGGVVVPEAASARRFLHFDSENLGTACTAPPRLAAEKYRSVPADVLADPLVQEAIAAVSAIRLDAGWRDSADGGPTTPKARIPSATNPKMAEVNSDMDGVGVNTNNPPLGHASDIPLEKLRTGVMRWTSSFYRALAPTPSSPWVRLSTLHQPKRTRWRRNKLLLFLNVGKIGTWQSLLTAPRLEVGATR